MSITVKPRYCAFKFAENSFFVFIGILSKTKNGHIHMDLADKGKGPNGCSVEFGADLFSAVVDLFR